MSGYIKNISFHGDHGFIMPVASAMVLKDCLVYESSSRKEEGRSHSPGDRLKVDMTRFQREPNR